MWWKNWCSSNTNLEKVLIFFVVLLSCAVLFLFISLLSQAHGDNGVCNNPQCVRAATHILDTIDPSVDPCEDFYKFTCGTFLKNAFSLGHPTTLHLLSELMKNELKEIVMETTDESKLPKTLVMQKKFYRACMNKTAIEEEADRTILGLLDEVVGGWPVVKMYAWMERNFDWPRAMIKARNLGFFYQFFFRVGIYTDFSKEHSNVLLIKPPYRTDVSSFHWKDESIEIIAEIASILGSKSVGATSELRRTMYFAQQLDELVEKYYNRTTEAEDDKVRNVTIKNLQHRFIKLNWLQFLQELTGVDLTGDDLVIFDVEQYFDDLYYLLLKTPKKIQANYIAWAIISTNIDLMTEKVREKYKEILKSSNDTNMNLFRSDTCYKLSKGLFKNVVEAEYVRRYTSPEKRRYIKDMVGNIKKELEIVLKTNTWMDTDTKDYAITHLKNITEAIGWTDLVYDVEKYDKAFGYDKLKMTTDNLVNMSREVAVNEVNNYYRQVVENVSDSGTEFFNTPKLEVNAYYLQYFNKLILPTPILQGLIFDEKRPRYMNYGSLGSIIGHEYTHGFTGKTLNDDLEYESWWTNDTIKNFKNVSQCLIDEYDQYPEQLSGFSKNGTLFEENLADFNGINIAYTAYQHWVRRNAHEENLPGVHYTPNQIFWIMASTYLCYEPRLSEKDDVIKKDLVHAVPSFRVIGRIRNSPYFAKDFNCPAGSKMNPENKCRIFS